MKVWCLIGCLVLLLLLILFLPRNPFDQSKVEVNIPAGASVKQVQLILQTNKTLPKYSIFKYFMRLFGLQNKIKAGNYLFSPSDPLPEVVTKLVLGETLAPKELRVTFPEGTSIYKMGIILKEAGYADWLAFQGLVKEGITYDLRQRHWPIFKFIPSESLEGYLFPDTYHIFKDAPATDLAEKLLARFKAIVLPYWQKNKRQTKMNLHEIITIASIVEKEAKRPEERPVIASVFYNRLKDGMPLAADPTVKYALERPSKIVYLDQLSVKSPYNTYKRRGLPPGPICNPGLDSIKAAIYPAKTNYYFFVAKKDGSHLFSKSWQEHQKARIK